MSIESQADWEGLRQVAKVARMTLDVLSGQVRPGVTTGELDAAAAQLFATHGARSAPAVVYGFPGTVLISLNDEIVHGIPGERRIRAGDIVKIDVTVEKDGYVADTARSVVVVPARTTARRLAACATAAFRAGLAVARAGVRVNEIGGPSSGKSVAEGFRSSRGWPGTGWGGRFMKRRRCRIATIRGSWTC